MSVVIDGTSGVTTPGVVNTAGETIATTLSVTGVTTLTGGLNAALPVLSGGTGVTTKTGTGAVVLGTSPTLTTPTFNSAQLSTITGTAPLAFARAWVVFGGGNGTTSGAIIGSFNVSSITVTATGNWTVNMATALASTAYSAMASTGGNASAANYGSNQTCQSVYTTSAFDVKHYEASALATVQYMQALVFI